MIDPFMLSVVKNDALVGLMSLESDIKETEELIILLRSNGFDVFEPRIIVENTEDGEKYD